MSRVVESISPARLGPGFRWLLASFWISNVGDGLSLAAGPLLVASQTRDPLLVALAALLQRVPWLLFGLWAGVLADRVDRRRLVVAVNVARAGVLAVLAAAVATGAVNVAVVLAAMFVLGTAETFADTTSGTLLPMMVRPADLGLANARLMVGQITANQLAGPPLGALLFAAGAAWPFAAQAVCIGLGAVLVARIATAPPTRTARADGARRQMVEGLRWVWSHPPVRTLTLTIVTFNVTFGATWSVLVLYATERLGLGPVGFGLLTTASAVGGVVGSAVYGPIERRVDLATLMRIGLVIETLTHLGLALTTVPAVAVVIFTVFGVHEAVWGTIATTVRQRAVPAEFQGRVVRQRAVPAAFQGRVGGVYMVGVHGGLVVGAALGGGLARAFGVTGPFWFAFGGCVVILALIWRELTNIAHARTDDDDRTRDPRRDGRLPHRDDAGGHRER